MSNLVYSSYYDRRTNTENIKELVEAIRDDNKRHNLIGLNLILTSLQIKKSNLSYDQRKDTVLRIGNAVRVSEGLDEVLAEISTEKVNSEGILINVDYVIYSLESRLKEFKIKTIRTISRNHLMGQPLYEVGTIFYYNKGSYQELGNKVENNFNTEKSIIESLQGINDIIKRLKFYEQNIDGYEILIKQIDRLKGKIFSKEEAIMRHQLVKLLGFPEY